MNVIGYDIVHFSSHFHWPGGADRSDCSTENGASAQCLGYYSSGYAIILAMLAILDVHDLYTVGQFL